MRLALAVVAALALAAPATAQESVVGGATFTSAPEVADGEYRDTVLPGEMRFYAVRVGPGQSVRATLTPEGDPDVFEAAVSWIEVNVQGPLREDTGLHRPDNLSQEDNETARVQTAPADPESGGDPYLAPGLWYVSVHAFHGREGRAPRVELPFTLGIERVGGDSPEPTPTETATATPEPSPEPDPEPESEESSPSGAEAAGVGVGGLLVGLVAGAVLGRRRRSA